jgi:hypothetical protein
MKNRDARKWGSKFQEGSLQQSDNHDKGFQYTRVDGEQIRE